ncbi:ribosome maturation factor RimP [Demequina mangrovi]|uniref:Ribosome maturation factor RimP n=1 Tax=Demequina mangrovi TaxID=1043493 RepID=A0A1H6Z7X6_9MICO|nr:ribosome maturation factor RimP [Demequina mangrovi]SEJ48826.1 ribosome maturation factor RimP [Demequina mangrovi]
MDISSRIIELAAPAAEAVGLVVEGVDVTAAGKRSRVLVTVDLPETEVGSADLDKVAEASRTIGAALDEANVPSTPYVLEVSTPGTDRALTERRHFLRARTRLVEIRLADRSVTGRVQDVDGDTVVLDVDGELQQVPLGEISEGRIVVELKRLGEK